MAIKGLRKCYSWKSYGSETCLYSFIFWL